VSLGLPVVSLNLPECVYASQDEFNSPRGQFRPPRRHFRIPRREFSVLTMSLAFPG